MSEALVTKGKIAPTDAAIPYPVEVQDITGTLVDEGVLTGTISEE